MAILYVCYTVFFTFFKFYIDNPIVLLNVSWNGGEQDSSAGCILSVFVGLMLE